MKPILTRLFAGLFLLVAAQAYGQFTTSFVVTSPGPAPSYPIGTHLVVELRVNGFTNVESMQFPIGFNKDALRFDSLSDAAFSNWNAGNFLGNNTVGKVGISWDGFSNGASMPFTFPNGTALFKLHFTVINNGTSVININPALAPPAIDVVANGSSLPTNFYQGGGTPTITLGTGAPPPPPLVGFKIVANTIYIPQGQRACMPVTVNDFDNIVSMQWAMHWDNSVLNFECVRGFNLTGWSATDFNSTLTPGTLLAGWADPAGVGVTRADGVRIVDVCFKAIGNPAASTTITIDGVGFPPGNGGAEAFNAASVNVWTAANHPNGASGVSAPVNILATPASSFDVTYTVDQVEAAPNSVGCVEVKVKNFTAITSAEFALGYTPAQLSFNNNDFGSNPLNLQASNLVSQPMNGVVKFQWSSANGATLADNTPIFKTCFTVLAPEGTTCPITFTTTACPSITGFGTAKSTGGVPYANVAGWIKSVTAGPKINIVQEVTCNGGSNGSLTVVNPATLSATAYAWSSGVGSTQTVSNLLAGTYTVTVTYSNGTTATDSRTLTAPPAIVATNTTSVVSCFGGSNGAIDLTVSGGTPNYTYNWGGGVTTEDRSNLTAGIYTVTITDSKGCTKTNTATVSGFIAINPTATVTNITCAGLTNGAISLSVVGGAGNYSYAWAPGGEVTKDISNKAAGTYTVTITDGNSCTRTTTAAITAPGPIAIQLVSKADVKCANTPTGAAAISVTGGTGLLNFCWSDGVGTGCDAQGPNPTALMPATYTVIGTDVNGCTGTMTNITIANPPAPLSVQGNTTPSPCFDQPTGSITSNGAGGWNTNYTYAWTGPVQLAPVPNHQPVPAGTYFVTVTDANQCTATNSFVVGGAPEITKNETVTHVKCFGENNGAINLNLAGGNQPYTLVKWDNTTLLGQSISTLAPGSYQPTITDAQGCTKIFPAITINGPQVLTIDTTIAEANPSNGSIDLEILSGGTPGFTYQWSNGANTQDISNLSPGFFTVTVTDAAGCVRTFTFEVKSGNVLGVPTVSSVKNSCEADGCIRINVASTAASFMPITLNWGFGSMQSSSLTPEICGLGAGVYNVTITASNGNSSVLSGVQIAQLDPASVNSNTTNPFSSINKNGKITLNKAPGVLCDLQYQWGPAPLNSTSNEVTNLGKGTYFVTITNPCSGCVNIEEFTLEYSPINSVATVLNPMCAATADGSINHSPQGGNPPYDYSWTGPNGFTATTEDISGLEPGVYSVTTTDQDDRVELKTYTLSAQSPLNITNVNETSLYGTFQVSGANTCDGAATLAFIPGIGTTNIQWSNGVTTASNSTLCAGAYSVTLTDTQGCTATWVDELTAPPAIALVSTEAPSVKCNGDCDGTAKIKVGGGVGPYSVRWSTGQFDPLVTANGFSQAVNLCGGEYEITVTDDNDVQQTFTVTVPEPAPIVAEFAATAPRNFNSCDGDLLIELTGAVFPITYVWSGNFGHTGNTERAEELCSGEFVEYFVTDANGCTAYFSDSIPYPEDGCFRVSPVITPGQQDGKNDFVVITCIETATENTMEIYNRWGQLVFETENYTNNDTDVEHNWNGLTSSGAVLAEGVYYYVLTFKYRDDQGILREGTRKGAINLLR